MNIEEKYNRLIEIFKEVSKVPRNSKNEEKIAEFLCNFAKARGLWYRKDEYNNVIIKKKATAGYENKKTIMFQAHTDMVCEKTLDSTHNFNTDPIEIIEEDGTLKAKDTTLGADDGVGAAYLLLLLEDEEIPHPDIECLFTVQEEIGMNGARAFNYSDIKAKYLINLDGEEENTAIVGCAGGVSVEYSKECELLDIEDKAYEMCISGLFGGHSGVDINKGRTNSNYLCAKILDELANVKIISFEGGNKDNAIANSTRVVFTTSTVDPAKTVNSVYCRFRMVKEDKDAKITINEVKTKQILKCIGKEESKALINLLIGLKQGVIEMSKDIENMVETSGNTGIVRVEEGKIKVIESLRSSIDAKKEEIKEKNNNFALKYGFSVAEDGDYPGWKYNPDSKLETVYKEAYMKVHENTEPIVCAIHAGVECGMIYEKLPYLDMISLGPDVKDVHTVNETLYLDSCKKMLVTLLDMIVNLD